MRWLIAEDALRDRRGHWLEYLGSMVRTLRVGGDTVTVLTGRDAEPFLAGQLQARPLLPPSIWHRMTDGAGAARRILRIPHHGWRTFWSMRAVLRREAPYDVIFVPSVLVHHLCGWVGLVKCGLVSQKTRLLLFFPNAPLESPGVDSPPRWVPAPTSRLFRFLVRRLRAEVAAGRVVLGTETRAMREALSRLCGMPFTYLPHPVEALPVTVSAPAPEEPAGGLTMACFGPARHEKGSEILAAAIALHLERHPESRTRFVLQWLGDYQLPSGELARIPDVLLGHPRVEIIRHLFAEGEYAERLRQVQILLLPYRHSSYAVRVSRVAIEALVNGLPVVVTRGSTLAEQAAEFGAAVLCEDGDVGSLADAIAAVERDYATWANEARKRQRAAQEHFSVMSFRKAMCGHAY